MAGEKILSSLWLALALLGMLHGSHGAYRVVPNQENVFHHGLKIVHPPERTEHYGPASQENSGTSFHQQQQHPLAVGDYQQFPHSAETHHVFFQPQPEQEYLVQSGYNVGPQVQPGQVVHHHEEPETQKPQQQQLKQRQTALPCNHERLHVKIDYPGAGHGIARPTATHPTVHQPQQQQQQQDYRSTIPKSIAPKLNPLHHSFHQNRNFVPLHHITRQVPVPAGHHGQAHPHSQQQQHHHQHQQPPVKAALAPPPPKHIAG